MRHYLLCSFLCLSVSGCHPKSKPTLVLLGDSITHGMVPPCDDGIKVSAMKLLGRGCAGMFDVRKELPGYNVIVLGFNGRRTDQLEKDTFQGAHGEDHVAEVLALHPATVVLMAGTNDLRVGVAPSTATANLSKIRERLSAQVPTVLVANLPYLTEVSHSTVREFNAHCGAAVDYFDALDAGDRQELQLFIDGIHPNGAGYRAMFPALKTALNR